MCRDTTDYHSISIKQCNAMSWLLFLVFLVVARGLGLGAGLGIGPEDGLGLGGGL